MIKYVWIVMVLLAASMSAEPFKILRKPEALSATPGSTVVNAVASDSEAQSRQTVVSMRGGDNMVPDEFYEKLVDAERFDPTTMSNRALEMLGDLLYAQPSKTVGKAIPMTDSNMEETLEKMSDTLARAYDASDYWAIVKGSAERTNFKGLEFYRVGSLSALIYYPGDKFAIAYLFSMNDFEIIPKTIRAVDKRYDDPTGERWIEAQRGIREAKAQFVVYTDRGFTYTDGEVTPFVPTGKTAPRANGYIINDLGPVTFPKDFGKSDAADNSASDLITYENAETYLAFKGISPSETYGEGHLIPGIKNSQRVKDLGLQITVTRKTTWDDVKKAREKDRQLETERQLAAPVVEPLQP